MFCPNCGKEIDDNSKFCQFCGNKNNEINNEDKTFNENDSKKLYYDNFLHNIEQKITKVETTFEFKNIILTIPDIDTKKILLQGEIYKKNNMQINKIKIILSIPKGFFKYEKFECELDIEDVYFKIQVPFEILEKFSGSNLFLTVMPQIEHKINNNIDKNISSKRNLGLGWLIGVSFIIDGIVLPLSSTTGVNYIGGLLLCLFGLLCIPPINQKIDSLLKERTDKKKIKIITGIVLFLLIPIVGINETNNNDNAESITNTKKSESAIQKNIKMFNKTSTQLKIHKAAIESGALYTIPESYGQGYDKTIKKHGMANIKKSNLLLPKAANLVAQNKSCDAITNVMLSDNRSTSSNLVIITDCKNGQRFYLLEKEIISNTGVQSEKDKLIKLLPTHVSMCETKIKNSLNYPSTYKKLISKTGFETDDMVNDIVVGFKAKNAFNLELEYQARCMLNSKNDFSIFNIKEVK